MGVGFHILAFSSALQFCKESENSHKMRSMNVVLCGHQFVLFVIRLYQTQDEFPSTSVS